MRIEMLATAVSLNLEGVSAALKHKMKRSNPNNSISAGGKTHNTFYQPGQGLWPLIQTVFLLMAPG